MDDLRTRALLVEFDPAQAGTGAIGTVIPRDEIAETAARGEFPATLLLDLDRVETEDGGEVTGQARVAVDWDEDDLDRLLASTEGDEIALWFDGRELARAFDESDVEAHGLRERAAVLAVAVAAAGVGVGSAHATPYGPGTGGSTAQPAAHFNVDPQARPGGPVVQPAGAERGLQQDEQIAVTQTQAKIAEESAATSSGGPSSGELAAIAGFGAVLISAAGFGVARKRTPPMRPA